MTESDRTVQVPVSSALRILDRNDAGRTAPQHDLELLRDLLSQPPAEPCSIKRGFVTEEVYCAVHGRAAGWPCKVTAEPPRIEDMAPGTTFTVEHRDMGSMRVWKTRSVIRPFVDDLGWPRALSEFDPSTIRDVTPPKGDNAPTA